MIQSDALSQWPDHCPEEDNDKEDMILLPENLFINLIDIDLQQQIAKVNSMDKDTETALLLLLNRHTTDDWTLEKFDDRNILFYQGWNYIPLDKELWWNILKTFHNHETAGHPENCKLIMQYKNIIGGQDFELLWKTTFKVAESVNSLK